MYEMQLACTSTHEHWKDRKREAEKTYLSDFRNLILDLKEDLVFTRNVQTDAVHDAILNTYLRGYSRLEGKVSKHSILL